MNRLTRKEKDVFLSQELQNKLSNIRKNSLSIIEAPAGYGKTTAIKYFLSDVEKKQQRWFTATSDVYGDSLAWFLRQIVELDEKNRKKLENISRINRSNIQEVTDVFLSLDIKEETFIVIDNFQFIAKEWFYQLFFALGNIPGENLHIIILTQDFRDYLMILNQLDCCYINANNLILMPEDILSYAKQLDIILSKETAEEIYKVCDGWVAAVDIILRNGLNNNNDAVQFDMNSLLSQFFWNKMTRMEQLTSLRFAHFERMSRNDVLQILSEADTQGNKSDYSIFLKMPLVRYDEVSDTYFLHEILNRFLQKKLEQCDKELYCEIVNQTAELYLSKGMISVAVGYFYMADNYTRIIQTDLSGLSGEMFHGTPFHMLAKKVLTNISDKDISDNPISALRLVMEMFGGADFVAYERCLKKCYSLIEAKNDNLLMAEYHIVEAYGKYPDLKAMTQCYRKAEELLNGHISKVINVKDPFFFGITSMWMAFYTVSGAMFEIADDLKEMMNVYNRITNNHGAGVYELYVAECYSSQGLFDDSEIMLHRADLECKRGQNVSVAFGVPLLMGINAVYQDDMVKLKEAIDYLERDSRSFAFMQGRHLNTTMIEVARSYLLALMLEPHKSVHSWTRMTSDSVTDVTFSNLIVKQSRITEMVIKKNYRQAIASLEAFLKVDYRLISVAVKGRILTSLSLINLVMGRTKKAVDYFDEALNMIKKDKCYSFIASFKKYFTILFHMPRIRMRHGDAIKQISNCLLNYSVVDEKKLFDLIDTSADILSSLTYKEKEVARMVANGMKNKEIAKTLSVSEETVKSHMKKIFKKLEIDRRSKLLELLQ